MQVSPGVWRVAIRESAAEVVSSASRVQQLRERATSAASTLGSAGVKEPADGGGLGHRLGAELGGRDAERSAVGRVALAGDHAESLERLQVTADGAGVEPDLARDVAGTHGARDVHRVQHAQAGALHGCAERGRLEHPHRLHQRCDDRVELPVVDRGTGCLGHASTIVHALRDARTQVV